VGMACVGVGSKGESSFSEEKEAKRLLSIGVCALPATSSNR
jgi:hypothetical protein